MAVNIRISNWIRMDFMIKNYSSAFLEKLNLDELSVFVSATQFFKSYFFSL